MNLLTGQELRRHGEYATTLEAPAGNLRADYAKLRHPDGSASGALRCARILERWRPMEDAGLVRVLYVSDPDPSCALEWLDQSADDMAEGNARAWTADGKRERERAERDGVFGLVGEYRTSENEDWETADSVWGFIGSDGLDVGGYASDIMSATLDALDKARGECCAHCGRPRIGEVRA